MTSNIFDEVAAPRETYYTTFTSGNVTNTGDANLVGENIAVADRAGIYDQTLLNIVTGKIQLTPMGSNSFYVKRDIIPPEQSAAKIVKCLLEDSIPKIDWGVSPIDRHIFTDDDGHTAIRFVDPQTGEISDQKTHRNIAVATEIRIIPGVERLLSTLLEIAPQYLSTVDAEDKVNALLCSIEEDIGLTEKSVTRGLKQDNFELNDKLDEHDELPDDAYDGNAGLPIFVI